MKIVIYLNICFVDWSSQEYQICQIKKICLCVCENVLQIPKSYLTLQEAVLAECQRRDAEDEVQYLTDLQLEQIIEQSPGSDIKDYEDLQTGN